MAAVGVLVGGAPLPEKGSPIDVSTATPWGEAADQPRALELGGTEYILLKRHGGDARTSPHQINYRANVWLLKQLGVTDLIGTHTVGSIDASLAVGELVLPVQLIDYTWGRAHTFDDERRHIDFSEPYSEALRTRIKASGVVLHDGGVYGCTQGPRLETKAEIARMARDGCSIVGMTALPEASLARELDLNYASVCVVVNPAAGVGPPTIDMAALSQASAAGASKIWALMEALPA